QPAETDRRGRGPTARRPSLGRKPRHFDGFPGAHGGGQGRRRRIRSIRRRDARMARQKTRRRLLHPTEIRRALEPARCPPSAGGNPIGRMDVPAEMGDRMREDFFRRAALCAALLGLWALYLSRLSPSVGVGDSGEFITGAVTLSLPHAPSYPLFSL